MTDDDRTAVRCLILGISMTALFAVMLFLTPPAHAAVCTSMANKDVLAHIEKNSGETLRFVGIISTGGEGIPVEVTVSAGGTFSLLELTPDGTCFVAVGTSWQAVEPKPPGVEN